MWQAYTINRGLEEFTAAREQFAYWVSQLQSSEVLGMEHGEVEALISQEGTELLRRLLQGHLDLRAAKETKREGVRGSDGVLRRQVRENCQRRLMTLFGEVKVKRLGYGAQGEESVFPLDGELNLPRDSYSHGLRQRVAEEVARGSFDEAVRAIERTTGGKVPKRQAEGLVAEVSQDVELFYSRRGADGPEQTLDPWVLSEDGKGIVMRRDDLREATRKALEREHHKLKTPLSQGEKRHRKRMATGRRFTAWSVMCAVLSRSWAWKPIRIRSPRPGRVTSGSGPVWSVSPRRSPKSSSRRRCDAIPSGGGPG